MSAPTEVRLLEATSGKWSSASVPPDLCCEDAVVKLVKRSLTISPVAVTLLGLKTAQGHWLAPNQIVGELEKSQVPLELRMRFKVPSPHRLREIDRQAFLYFYHQVRHDFSRGDIVKAFLHQQQQRRSVSTTSWLLRLSGECDESHESTRVALFGFVTKLASIIMMVDILDSGKTQKEVVKNVRDYIPKEMYSSFHEKLIGNSKVKGLAERCVASHVANRANSTNLKLEFLSEMEEKFPTYFEDYFEAVYEDRARGSHSNIRLAVKPPYKGRTSSEETEPELEMQERKGGEFKAICSIEEVCSISARGEDLNCVELLRKNGVPVYLSMKSKLEALSFLSHLSGYYRLCEKWTFSLCSDIVYNSLKFNMTCNVHGPVCEEFVSEKFRQKGQTKSAPYLLCQSCHYFDKFVLHFQSEIDSKLGAINIDRLEDGKYSAVLPVAAEQLGVGNGTITNFDSLPLLVRHLLVPSCTLAGQQPVIKDCLHPSEFDRADTLLLCRSVAKRKADFTGESVDQNSEPKLMIPFKQLSRIENHRYEGKFTTVWKGTWQTSKAKQEVAIKQLKPKFQNSKLSDFSHMIYNTLAWDDGTLVKIFATCLHTRFEPMAAVTEYFPLGPLDAYLRDNHCLMQDVDLVEACASLSRALWYLDEKGTKTHSNINTHGNIRCSNVFVALHDESAFKVKLGDSGLADVYHWDQVHWLPVELLAKENPTPLDSTIKADVWALATTFWQIFSGGNTPQAGVDHLVARQMYLRGDRLVKPEGLRHPLDSLYRVMEDCWHPLLDLRKEPQSVMQDTNQLLYKVFNARHFHSYVSIDDQSDLSLGGLSTGSDKDRSTSGTLVSTLEPSETSTIQLSSPMGPSEGATPKMVPTYNRLMKKITQRGWPNGGSDSMSDIVVTTGSCSDYTDALFYSRPGSSLEGSMLQTDMSQFTSQTSLASYSTLYSMSSIYQLCDENQLELNREFPLGQGNFGIVYKGVMSRSKDEWELVAVKMLKDEMSSEAAEEMQREYEIMKDLRHNNVVKIKGVLLDQAKVIIIMEYIKEGSLDRYLHIHKVHIKQLFTFALNIVDGMIYLGQKGIIHRDLAARNILVASDELVKISDFGLARTIVNNDHYVMCSNTNIPVKWLALECLTHKLFTFASDVWSFGITLWEMWEMGTPYLHGCHNFFKAGAGDTQHQEDMKMWLQYLDEGMRLPKPERCPSSVYSEIMLPCWRKEPSDRPTFPQLRKLLGQVELQVT